MLAGSTKLYLSIFAARRIIQRNAGVIRPALLEDVRLEDLVHLRRRQSGFPGIVIRILMIF